MDLLGTLKPEEIPRSDWETQTLRVGEVYRFTYEKRFFLSQGSVDSMIARIAGDPHFDVIDFKQTDGMFTLTAKVIKASPIPLGYIIAVVATAALGVFAFLSLTKVEKIISSPLGGIAFAAVAIAIATFVFRRDRG